jgi:hypothetical protein
MTTNTLPVPVTAESEALAYAREWIADMRASRDFCGLGVGVFDEDGGEVVIGNLINMLLNGKSECALVVLDWAYAGWPPADTAIREICSECARRGIPVDPLLAEYQARAMKKAPLSRKRGGDLSQNILCDIALVTLVMTLCEKFGLRETRGPYSRRRESACSVVSRAATEAKLHRGGEDALNKIAKRYLPGVRWLSYQNAGCGRKNGNYLLLEFQ